MTHNLSRNDNVWCMNLATGDIFNKRKWMDYYNIDQDDPELGHFCEGTILGILLDMDRGYMNFYKDTHDMGQAFVSLELKYGDFHPFIQANCKCKISLFHPVVYPAYREPGEGDSRDYTYEEV